MIAVVCGSCSELRLLDHRATGAIPSPPAEILPPRAGSSVKCAPLESFPPASDAAKLPISMYAEAQCNPSQFLARCLAGAGDPLPEFFIVTVSSGFYISNSASFGGKKQPSAARRWAGCASKARSGPLGGNPERHASRSVSVTDRGPERSLNSSTSNTPGDGEIIDRGPEAVDQRETDILALRPSIET